MMRRAALPFVVTAVIAGLIATALAAPAPPVRIPDANDTLGRLDVKLVRFHYFPAPATWDVVTFRPWLAKDVWDTGNVFVFLDTQGDETPEYYVGVRSTGHRLVADLFRARNDHVLFPVNVRRRNRVSVTVSVPVYRLRFGAKRTFYRWSVLTSYVGRVCPATCFDQVPDAGTPSPRQPRPKAPRR
jgi:hypothetical protein